MVRLLTRKKFLITSGGAAAAAAAGGAGLGLLGGIADARTAPSPEQDRRILSFLLELQRVEAAFYALAARAGLRGDAAPFIRDAGADERRHVAALESALGSSSPAAGNVRFALGDALRTPQAFAAKAVALEDAVVGACNGQATNLTPDALALVFSIVSVEARHATWARDLAGMPPADDATDAPRDADDVRDLLRGEGMTA
jgi:ferritin-like protein